MARPVRSITLRDHMSDNRPYSSCPTVEVLRVCRWLLLGGGLQDVKEEHIHEVAVGDPRDLRG
jgi:hypothetical protein